MVDLHERCIQWIVVDGSRHMVAGLFVSISFVTLVVLGWSGVIRLENQAAVRGIAGGFIPGLIAFLSIVLTIN